MDFFQRQDQARRKTKLLVFYFVVAVVLLIALGYAASLAVFNYAVINDAGHRHYDDAPVQLILWQPKLLLGVVFGTLAVIFGGSAYKTMELSGGGGSVATTLGGRLVSSSTTDPDERKLLNVVEEMAIASGVPMPQVYVLDNERAINAFAAGHTTSDAAIGVTRGAIQMLSRDELQGVIGHEFSHVLNGDMRLNLRLIGIIFGLLCIATIGRILLRARSSGKDKNPLPLIGIILLLLGSIGVFFGRLIQSAVSRQREFLADASSVQFTRNPAGLSGALQKIGRFSFGSRLESDHAPDMCHMFFGNGLGESLMGMMATHPPIPDRIRAIDPSWDGKFPPLDPKQIETVRRAAYSELKRPATPDAFRTILGGAIVASENAAKPPVIRPQAIMPNIGNPQPLHLRYAEALRDALPDSVRAAARNPLDAVALTYAMILSADETMRARQLDGLKQRAAPGIAEKAAALYPDVMTASARARLPMVNIALGALRELSQRQFDEFSQTLKWLVASDERVELFELVLQKIVLHHLAPKFSNAKPPVIQFYTLKPLVPDCILLLSALAHIGNRPDQVQWAFDKGVPYLRPPTNDGLQLVPREECSVPAVDAALNRLALAVPLIKKNLLEACVQVIGADGVVQESEAELLRAVADTLDCPMPPLVANA